MSLRAPDSQLPALILLLRHGATEWSLAGRHTGRTDLPLTALGERQASEAATLVTNLLAGAQPLVFTSPLERAVRTAELALPDHYAEPMSSLTEYDYGDYEGLTSREILARDPNWDLFEDGCPGGEKIQQVTARCDAFIAKMERVAAGRVVVAVTHGHLSRLLTARLLGLSPGTAASLWNDTGSVGVINEHRGRLVLVGWNRVAG